MNKKLRSFHKLFFIVFFSFLFSSLVVRGNTPDLPEKIAPELERIESLPRRTKPAELNIEVTKIKSEPLEEVYIDRKNKNIYVDFSKKREQALRGVKNAEDLEKKYNLIISEDVQGSSEVNGRSKGRNKSTSQIINYEVVEYEGKKVLKIPYENEPKKLYISIQENENRQLKKIYTINMANVQVFNIKGIILEDKVVIVNLKNGIEHWKNAKFVFNLDGTLYAGTDGEKTENVDLSKVQIIKNSGFNSGNDGFINSFRQDVDIKVNSLGAKDSITKTLYKGDQNSNEAQFYYTQKPDDSGNGQDGIAIKFLTNGNLTFRFQHIDSSGNVTYTINIEHIEKNTGNIKKHTLIINAKQNTSLKDYFTYINPANRILIKESELKNDFNIDGTAKYPEKIYKFYSQEEVGMKLNNQLENLNLFPAVYLGNENNNGDYRIQSQKLPYRIQINGGGTGLITLVPNLSMSDFSYEHTVAAGSAPEKPSSDTFYNAVGGGVVTPTKNAIYTKIAFYVKGENLEKLLRKSKESLNQIVHLPYTENYSFSLSPGNYLNSGNNCYLPSLNIDSGDVLQFQLPPIEIEKSQESLNGKTLERKFQLNDLVINDDEEIKNEYLLGYLENKQIGNYIEQGRPFPVISLGSQLETNNSGWGWSSVNNPNNSFRENVVSEFKSTIGNLSVELYFKDIVSNPSVGKIERGRNEQINMIGSYLDGYSEQVEGNLYGSFQDIQVVKEMVNKARKSNLQEVIFRSEDLEQINFVMGQFLYVEGWRNYYYTIPALGNLTNSGEEKKYKHNYPNIKIVKKLIEDKLTLNLKEGFNIENLIKFSKDGVAQENITLETSKNLYLKSLNYLSYITFNNNDFLEIDSNGNTKEEVVMLKDVSTNNQLKLSIKYELGYPILKINEYDGKGEYILNIKHYDPSIPTKLKRRDYILKIIIENDKKLFDFKIDKNINEIIIRKENENFIVEYPNNKVSIIQQTKDSTVFPVIALNSKEKWQMNTALPFNPIDKRPWSSFDIGENIKVSTSLRETPYQNIKKFFIYNKGELSNRNIAVGGYNDKELEGDKNKVEIDFKIDFSQEILEKFWVYSQRFSENKVLIPYSSTDDEINKIYAIKGERDINGFKINSLNILEEIAFPKVYVLKEKALKENTAILTLKNPVPKSDLNLKGSFDINSDGLKLPNDMPYTLEHPESLNISGVTQEWQGYSKINEYHKIDIKILRDGVTNFIKTITTNSDGTLKDEIKISNDDKYSYVLKKGKNSLVAIGLETWDLNKTTQYEETLILEHKNSSGRVTHIDKYNIIIEKFSLLTYLAQPNPIPIDKKLVKQIETETQRVPLIDFQLKNYDKEITKSPNDNIGVRIIVPTQEIILSSSSSSISGILSFIGDKSSLQNPNEIGSLVFTVTSGIIEAGKTYSYSYNGRNPLVIITTSKLTENIIEKLEISGTNIGADLYFEYFNAKSNLKEIIINDSINISDTGMNLSMGKVSLQQNGHVPNQGSLMHVFPAIALGKRKNFGWEVQLESVNNTNKRELVFTKYSFEKNPTSEISLRTFISGYTNSSNTYSYEKNDKEGKTIIVGSYKWGDLQEKIESEIKLTLSKVILEKAREISGNRIILKANTDVDNKIALIHSQKSNSIFNKGYFYLPTNNTEVPDNDRVRYFNYKDIIIEKDSFTKNLALNFLKTYINDTKIVLKKDSVIIPEGVENTIYEEGVLYGTNFKNKIKISSSDGTILSGITEYETDAFGNTAPIEIKMTKNGAEATLNINYNTLNASLSLKNIKEQETFNISLEHIEASGDTRRKYNIALKTNSEDKDSYKEGEIDLVISSRYNSFGGMGVLLKEGEIVYPKEVLDLNLIKGDFPYKPTQSIENIFLETHEGEFQLIDILRKILTNGTQIDITKYKNGDILINPFYWRDNNQSDSFNLIYKNRNNEILEKYKFNIKTPNFFVASSGTLDFGKIYKMGNPKDVIGEADIELYYNDGNIRATYTLDIDKGIPESGSLYLDDSNNLLVKKFILGKENIDSNDSRKRNIKLTGVIDGESIKNTPPGQYEKILQLLIHIQ